MQQQKTIDGRLLSLDVMRGMIMILLAAESCRIYESLHETHVADGLITQFFHHPWHGLRFWDLVQPAFMFMAGTAMYIAVTHKRAKGQPTLGHIAQRSLKLFIAGVALHCVYAHALVWELWNVLTQLAFTTMVAYFLIGRSFIVQIGVALGMILLNDVLYRTVLMPGFDQPFVEGQNFGAYMDTILMGKINSDGWVAFNCVPTAAHTILGVSAGQLLMGPWSNAVKIRTLLIAGTIALALGYGLDLSGVSPIIKRISTGGFVLVSAGWVFLILAALYWWIDIKDHKRFTWIAVVVGMNSIFIYLFFETVGVQWLNGVVAIFLPHPVLAAFGVWLLEWGLCYWLYKKKIFFKL